MIEFDQCSIRFDSGFTLRELNWRIESRVVSPGNAWAVVGPNGAGKSALAACLLGAGEVISGSRTLGYQRGSLVSLEEQARLIDRERQRDDSDLTDTISEGTPVGELLFEVCLDETLQTELIDLLGLHPLLGRGFRKLSTGETRKVLLVRSLICQPDFIVLDEPFEGLDARSVREVTDLLAQVARRVPMVLIGNRIDDIPDFAGAVACLQRCDLQASSVQQFSSQPVKAVPKQSGESTITHQFICNDADAMCELKTALHQLWHLRDRNLAFPDADWPHDLPCNQDGSLVCMKNARVSYTDNLVFDKLNWQINPGEHWQVSGPNGSGKTCLLNLITGDHPQCYVNDISLFGYRRGQGETIWDIKKHLGFVSTALHWDYRPGVGVRNAIISGFYDSIGLYQQATEREVDIAESWLAFLGMSDRWQQPFSGLSFGEQRLLLIARAMVKQPPLLLLDEPCLGLDDLNRQLVLALVERVCHAGHTTVVYVTHHAEDVISGMNNHLALP